MYIEPFQLKDLPFRLSPDPQFLFLSKQHARAKAYMESTIWFADGFVVITGEIGAGKTTLIESFLSELPQDVVVAQINQTQVSAVDFLQSLLAQFGFSPFKMKKSELLVTLNNFLIEQYAAGRRVLLVVDEAQNLSQRVLEEVRLLSGVETTKEKVLRIILAGQPELNAKLDAPELVQLNQRVRLRFHLSALSEEETAEYIQHRLKVAGAAERQIFEPETFPEIYRFTGGVPRLINTLCDTAMMAAFTADRDHVTAEDIDSAVGELQWVEFAARPQQRPTSALARARRGPDPAQPPLGRLQVLEGGQTRQELALLPGRLIVGRTPDNDVQIDSRFISRHHCQITTTDHACIIEDLNSTNGLYVRSLRVHRHYLRDGDIVLIGKHELLYLDERLPHLRANGNDTLPGIPALGHEDDTLAGEDLPLQIPTVSPRSES